MGKIQQLPPHEIHKIAAGEVVERPANVVKELLENALDAGAKNVTVYAVQGGKTCIRVVDDGCGMSPEDARMAIVHHATSKITSVDELEFIKTYGFRGEALSSISSVSRMTLITKEADSLEGYKLSITSGETVMENSIAAPIGTDITVEDLFFNVPARRKFLKADDTEWRAIQQLVTAAALTYPERSFKLVHNDRVVFQCNGTDSLKRRIEELYDRPYCASSVECLLEETAFGFKMWGTMTTGHYMRYDRSQILIFVNNRWVKNTKLTSAFIKGYNNMLPKGRYPAGVVFIEIDTKQVDINIHPRKEEVQFLHPRRVEAALERMVRSTHEKQTTTHFAIPAVKDPIRIELKPNQEFPQRNYTQSNLFMARDESRSQEPGASETRNDAHFSKMLETVFTPAQQESVIPVQSEALPIEVHHETQDVGEQRDYTCIGVLKNTYILIENEQGLLMVDQHAAHERVLYELFATRFETVSVVPLLFPMVISVSLGESAALLQHTDLFKSYGIELEQYGPTQFAIRSLPVMLKNVDVADLVRSLIHDIAEHGDTDKVFEKVHHALRAQMACKAAVKAGDTLTETQIHELITSLNKVENRFTCPHGRPTSWFLSFYDIERSFKRKV